MPSFSMRTNAIFAFFILVLTTGFSFASTSAITNIEYSHKGKQPQQMLPDLRKYPSGTPRKKAFLNAIVPTIDKVNREIMNDRSWLLEHQDAKHWSPSDIAKLRTLCQRYDMTCNSPKRTDWGSLLHRVDILPTHFVATQAATESGWGTSKLAQSNNNLFGLRCKQSCRAAPGQVKGYYSYKTIEESVIAYIQNMNTHKAYNSLRSERAKQRLGEDDSLSTPELIRQLAGYSQKGASYNRYLLQMYDSNKTLISKAQKVARNS
ncbi:protein bax [Serratia sp. S1B]|nr:protein bax [Serratia sp. S1B]